MTSTTDQTGTSTDRPKRPPVTERERRMVWTRIDGLLCRPGGTSEVATELGVNLTNVTTWVGRRTLGANGAEPPRPLVPPFAMGPIYDLDEWRAWRGLDRETPPYQ